MARDLVNGGLVYGSLREIARSQSAVAAALRSVDRAAREECARRIDDAIFDWTEPMDNWSRGESYAKSEALRAIRNTIR